MKELEEARPERLDQYVTAQLPEYSRAYAAKLIEQGKVSVNGQPQLKAGYKIKQSDEIVVGHEPAEALDIPAIELEVLYEDDDAVVINKPAGLLTHSKGAFNPEPTVATWLSSRVSGLTGERAGIVHRLDRATSGVMIAAKTPEALSWLQKQFSTRKVKKTYLAVVTGTLKVERAVIDMPIERNPKRPQTFRTGSNGKSATTEYQVVQSDGKNSLIQLKPTTGRTHQLRVHMSQIGHPILGDTLYGGQAATRLYLHALSLELTLPSKERRTFTVDLPPEFKEAVGQ